MALYKYIAAKPGQNPEEIVIEGANEKEALAKIRLRGMIPVRFAGVEDAGKKRFGGKRADVYEFTRQLTPLLGANIPLEQSLAIISEGSSDQVQKDFDLTELGFASGEESLGERMRAYYSDSDVQKYGVLAICVEREN